MPVPHHLHGMRIHLTPALLILLLSPLHAHADGCKFAADGRLIPEREQRAVIDWDGGLETLYVATHSDPTSDASVWIVPVRAEPTAIRAEPVDEFPVVVYYETLRGRAGRQLREAVSFAAVLDSGGLCCPLFIGGCGGGAAAPAAAEVSRVERLGMVVTVVAAASRGEIERYLDAQGVNRSGVNFSSLEPYFGNSSFGFVCGWVAKRGEPVAASGMKIVFPSPTLWFPLLPTRIYAEPVETVVFARGFVKPADGCDITGLACEYVYGVVESRGVTQAFKGDRERSFFSYAYSGRKERLTRITLPTDTRLWDRDLDLEPGTTAAGTVALAVTGWAGFLGPLWSSLLGAALGLAIPLFTVPRTVRKRADWLAGALTGAAIVLTIWASLLVFTVWRWWRFRGQPRQPRRYIVLPALAAVHFAVVAGVCYGLMAWL